MINRFFISKLRVLAAPQLAPQTFPITPATVFSSTYSRQWAGDRLARHNPAANLGEVAQERLADRSPRCRSHASSSPIAWLYAIDY